MSKDGTEEKVMWIYNALEVTIVPKGDNIDEGYEESETKFTYELVDYQDDSL